MGTYQEKLTVKIDPDLMLDVYRVMQQGGYRTVSELVRTALRHFISESTRKHTPNTLLITLPQQLSQQLQRAHARGFITDIERFAEEAIRYRLHEVVRESKEVDEFLNSLPPLEEELVPEEAFEEKNKGSDGD